ncbi:MAG: Crp/Fnr family transcriptional regulator [Deltaproteobacteria bacterium]|nr:MAG: Crp/Fnr family transcriptional regulator [Deltaproteobacteria bacterium]
MSVEDQLFARFGREVPAGTVLFREGEAGREMYVIHAGKVRITKTVRGQEKELAVLGQGEFFGEMSILNNKPRSATATVIEDARLLVLDPKTYETMLRNSTEIALRMVKRLAERLQEADDVIENLMLRDPASRVTHFLVRRAQRDSGLAPVTPDELPAQIGLKPEEVERVYETLERKGLIEVTPEGTQVRDRAKLEQFLDFLEMREEFGED